MKEKQQPIQQLTEIRNLMERSSRFISLSGLSGVTAGIAALVGAGIAFAYVDFSPQNFDIGRYPDSYVNLPQGSRLFVAVDALIVLILALGSAVFFTTRRARKKGLKVWDSTTRRMIINLLIPLVAGGIFCLAMIYYHLLFMIAPAMLIFYGLALLNAGKYTFNEIRVLGICEIFIGLVALFMPAYGMFFWATGFGLMHIFYGLMMYYRYETSEL